MFPSKKRYWTIFLLAFLLTGCDPSSGSDQDVDCGEEDSDSGSEGDDAIDGEPGDEEGSSSDPGDDDIDEGGEDEELVQVVKHAYGHDEERAGGGEDVEDLKQPERRQSERQQRQPLELEQQRPERQHHLYPEHQ